jgi:hypothetical protein
LIYRAIINESKAILFCDLQGYYKRVPSYFDVLERKVRGVFETPMVHSALLIDMLYVVSEKLSYSKPPGYDGPHDDIIIFARNVRDAGTCKLMMWVYDHSNLIHY